jgi:hypothetical protein
MVVLRHCGQLILNLASRGPTPSATLMDYAHSRQRSCSQVSSIIVLDSFLQFKHGLFIMSYINYTKATLTRSHQTSETTTKTTSKTTSKTIASEAASESSSRSLEWIACRRHSSSWFGDRPSKLIESQNEISWLLVSLHHWTVERIDRVISGSWRYHKRIISLWPLIVI